MCKQVDIHQCELQSYMYRTEMYEHLYQKEQKNQQQKFEPTWKSVEKSFLIQQ